MADTLKAPNEPPPLLRVALVAGADDAARLNTALADVENVSVTAHAGVPRAAVLPELEWYDDQRAMLARGGIDALLISASARAAHELGALAAECGVHVWRRPPLGRTFAEAIESVRHARTHETTLRVASWWDAVATGMNPDVEFAPRFSELSVSTTGLALDSWRGDRGEAGGGVLMYECYDLLEALLSHCGLPETVHAAIGRARRTAGSADRETEDVGAALLRFDDGGLAVVRGRRDIEPRHQVLELHGDTATLRIVPNELADTTAGEPLAVEMRRFFDAIRSDEARRANERTLERHGAVAAVLDAMYLSARTGQLENPRSLYEVERWPSWRTSDLRSSA